METSIGKKILPLPRLIVVVPDDDIIKCVLQKDITSDLSKAMGRLVNFVMLEHERSIRSFKEKLPAKAKRPEYPHILWIMAPLHDKFTNNSERLKFNRVCEDMCKYPNNISCFELKKIRGKHDMGLFCEDTNRYTAEGYKTYWDAVDHTIRYCDTAIIKKNEKLMKRASKPILGQNDPYMWQNPKIAAPRRKLPTPPKKI